MADSFSGAVRWAGDPSKCLDVQGAILDRWLRQFSWSATDGRIRWLTYPSFCLHGTKLGQPVSLARCDELPPRVSARPRGVQALCLGHWLCLKVEAPDNFALDGTPVQLAKMPLAERSASTYPWLFEVGLPCTGESYCAPLADCYEACRLSGDFDEACWQSSCCPSATMREFNNSELNYYVCTFTHNSCLSRCNTHFKSRRCGKDGKTYCPALADCYEACRLDGRTGSCQDFPCCPAKVDGFNESTEKFFLCEHVGNTCLTSCNEEHGPYRYCDGRSHCKQLAGCYEECANFGLAPELCSSETSCCPVFGDADGTDGYLDPDLGYFTCDDGNPCLERCNGRFAAEEMGTLQSRHIPRPDVLNIMAQLRHQDDDPVPGSPLTTAILVLSFLLILLAFGLAMLQRRKQLPPWTGSFGRYLQRQRLDFVEPAEEQAVFERLEAEEREPLDREPEEREPLDREERTQDAASPQGGADTGPEGGPEKGFEGAEGGTAVGIQRLAE
ncbi:unnamed protein product [Effrenium voratum]|uniref:Uncharacterized protein n=1 Tax=Effrenium voratum TaxID=2562239 RepID=A0AA36JRM6_9DINO|nr:unnamed protein product [Effrenium voratum]CAJ1413683.1 unnamed protein product [Effrenium voratum]